MGTAHLALSDWRTLVRMARTRWWLTASNAETGQALWFAVAGGALLTMGFLTHRTADGRSALLAASIAFILTMLAAFTATGMLGAGTGVLVGLAMLVSALRSRSSRAEVAS